LNKEIRKVFILFRRGDKTWLLLARWGGHRFQNFEKGGMGFKKNGMWGEKIFHR